jgi:ribosomal-protein-alanine N-acetyltransferase
MLPISHLMCAEGDRIPAITMNEMPALETTRLLIRPFVMADLTDAHRLFDRELRAEDLRVDKMESIEERAAWLQWAVLNYAQLAKLNQPPYGDRAITLKSTGQLVGSCGYVPCLNAFEQLPNLSYYDRSGEPGRYTAEVGLFYAISPTQQRRGYASEAAQALVDYAFQELRLQRIVATTDYDNVGSMGVMSRLGMRVEKNPLAEPPWLQVVGVLAHTDWRGRSVDG